LWELPGGEGTDETALAAVLRRRVGAALAAAEARGDVAHTFSHLHLDTTVFAASLAEEPALGEDVRWVSVADIDGMALSTLARKTLRVARGAP